MSGRVCIKATKGQIGHHFKGRGLKADEQRLEYIRMLTPETFDLAMRKEARLPRGFNSPATTPYTLSYPPL